MGELFSLMAVHALHAGLHFKHEAYRHESEYRFLRVYPPKQPSVMLKRRERAGASIKYEEFNWAAASLSPLRRIIAGPACDFNQAVPFIQDLLHRTPASPVEVIRSLIPYLAG
jgi:hypothetical protein